MNRLISISNWFLLLFMACIATIASHKEVKPRDYQIYLRGDTVYVYDDTQYIAGFIDTTLKNTIMKKLVSDYVKSLGGTVNYSGNARVMFITDPLDWDSIQSIEECCYNKFGLDLPFKLKTNESN